MDRWMDRRMRRNAGFLGTALVMTTSFGLAGLAAWPSTAASATASSKTKISSGSKWTVVSAQVFCEVVTFHAKGTFTSKNGASGTWTGGGKTLEMTWPGTAGFTFSGTWSRAPLKEYTGTFNGNDQFPGQVEEGVSKC
jgi:hypothetical protein